MNIKVTKATYMYSKPAVFKFSIQWLLKSI